MHLLIANDDGIEAPGLIALAERMSRVGTVWVVAPATEQSAQSHSLTMHKPLRLVPRGERRWAVSGTPADCIYVALHHLLPERPALVLSGINSGSNLGSDVHYSGTVAAAREAALHGMQAVAVSLHRELGDTERHWDTAAAVAERVARAVLDSPLAPRVHLNVNVPNRPLAAIRGIRTCALGERAYEPAVVERTDPRGRPYVWIGGPHAHFGSDASADGPAVEEGWVAVTPLSPDLTHAPSLERLRAWTDA